MIALSEAWHEIAVADPRRLSSHGCQGSCAFRRGYATGGCCRSANDDPIDCKPFPHEFALKSSYAMLRLR